MIFFNLWKVWCDFNIEGTLLLRAKIANKNRNKNHWNLSRILRRWFILSLRLCSWCAMCSFASIWSLYFLISSGNLCVQSPLINGAKSGSVVVSSVTNSWAGSVMKLFARVINMKERRRKTRFIIGQMISEIIIFKMNKTPNLYWVWFAN